MKVVGTITNVRDGVIAEGKQNAGRPWQQVTIEGIRLFVPFELQNGWATGQRVRCEVSHQGDKRIADSAGKTVAYESQFQLLGIERVVLAAE